MKPIALLVNSEDMFTTAKDAIAHAGAEDDVEMIMTHTYEESLKIARNYKAAGGLCIIARGGHARYLRASNLGLPITAIPFMGNDIAAMLVRATNEWGEFAVIGNATMVQMTRELERPIGAKIHYYEIRQWADFDTILSQLRDAGIKAVIGGYDVTRAARAYGIHDYCIRTSEYEIITAIIEAKGVVSALVRDQHWDKLFAAALDTISEGVVVIDSKGAVSHANRRAIKLLGTDGELDGLPLPEMQAMKDKALGEGAPIYDELYEYNDYKFTASFLPIREQENSLVIVMQEVEYVHKIERKIRQKLANKGLIAKNSFDNICAESPILKKSVQTAKRYAVANSSVLISGETGTGKEMFAQSIHNYSRRRGEAFVAVNCATIPANLLESELFGYVEGAFTGAKRGGKVGLFELAHNGTIFLDEIAEIGTPIQAQLLRVMEEKQIMRIGDDKIIPVNVRIIAATNKNLRKMVQQEKFREDLFYRINVLELHLPPVCEREGDARRLLEYLLESFAEKIGRPALKVTPEAMQLLTEYRWPGNVREMANVAERLTVTNESGSIGRDEVLELLYHDYDEQPERQVPPEASDEDVACALAKCGGNKTAAAAMLNISRPTLYRRMRELGIK